MTAGLLVVLAALAVALAARTAALSRRCRQHANAHAQYVTGLKAADEAVAAASADSAEALADVNARCARLTAERDAAIRAGQLAATAVLTSLARERAEHALDLAAAYEITAASARPALTAGRPAPPELLPGGQHALTGSGVLLQLDGVWDELDTLPAGTSGTGDER